MSSALHTDTAGRGPRLVLVHGFTQTGSSWSPLTADLAADHEVVTVDAPNHGRSAGVEADLGRGGELIAEAGGHGTYVGYSMGGRLCLHTALAAPDRVHGLVLIGATGGLDGVDDRAARRLDDERRADRIRRIGLDRFLDEWLSQPLFAGLDDAAQGREARRENTAEGLARSLELAGTGTQEPLWERLAAITAPVLVLAGERDERFGAVGERLAATIGDNATYAMVPGAGHTAHLERPVAFLAILRPWLHEHGL